MKIRSQSQFRVGMVNEYIKDNVYLSVPEGV